MKTLSFLIFTAFGLTACTTVSSYRNPASGETNAGQEFKIPYQQLQKGAVSFSCYTPGSLNGALEAIPILGFDLSLNADQKTPGTLSVDNLQEGYANLKGPSMHPLSVAWSSSYGSIRAIGTPYEKVAYTMGYAVAPQGQTAGKQLGLLITQDYKNGIVFARYSQTVITPDATTRRNNMNTVIDYVYLCEPVQRDSKTSP
jgi:hypothetical protein